MATMHRIKGLTLVELMIALLIGSLLILSLLTMMSNSSQSGRQLMRSATQSENTRYASDLLQSELTLAGFMGELPLQSIRHVSAANTPYTAMAPCAATPEGVMAYDGSANPPLKVPSAVQGIAANEATPCLPDRKAGTAAILIQRLATESQPVSAMGNAWVTQYSFCDQDPDTRLILSNVAGDLTLRDKDCKTISPVRRHVARLYYIARCNQCGAGGDDAPTLKRAELGAGGWSRVAMVEGIESLLFEFGFDTDNNGSPDLYRTSIGEPDAADGTWGNVMAVKTHFVSVSDATDAVAARTAHVTFQFGDLAPFTPPQDGHIRQGHSLMTRLVNPSAARE